jgi:enamine deaminase RidA (YjgF/YER057c/UK114 family)
MRSSPIKYGTILATSNRYREGKHLLASSKVRTRYSTNTIFERSVGYSRAVRVGDHVYVSGTTSAIASGEIVGEGDAYAQTVQILQTIATSLERVGASLPEVVRYRAYLTRIEDTPDVSRALYEAFGDIRPANTLLAIGALADSRMLVEIDADAIIGSALAEDVE